MKYIKNHSAQYILGMITLFVVDFANIFIPKVIGNITDGLRYGSLDYNGVIILLIKFLCLGITLAVGRFFWRYFIFGGARNIEKEMRNDMYEHLSLMSVRYYNENKTGDLMTRFTSDLNAVRMAIGPGVISAFDATIMMFMVIIQMMIYVNVRLTLLVAIPMLLILFGEIYFGKVLHKHFTARQQSVSALTDYVQESFSGARVIKAFVRERSEVYRFLAANKDTMDKNLRIAKLQSIVIPLLDVVIGISGLITLLYGGWLTIEGEITLGRFMAFYQYVNMLVWPMLACGESINMFSQGAASAKRIQDILDEQPDIADRIDVSADAVIEGDITLSGLSFTHSGSEKGALYGMDLHIKKGSTVAIIGRTGCGKSTLVNLLLHLYNVPDGMIFYDGADINSIPLKTLRESIAYVPQDNFLFSDTLAANIAFGKPDATMDEIIKAADDACIHDNIIDFPAGYDTVVGERGVTLSGGQKQRTSIARALLKNSPILILDDALSAVDTDTEERIFNNLSQNRKGMTTIVIAHRISTIKNADLIVVLNEGVIAEQGTHNELMELCGLYYEMYEHQQLEALKAASKEADSQ